MTRTKFARGKNWTKSKIVVKQVYSADKFFKTKIATIHFLAKMFQRQFHICSAASADRPLTGYIGVIILSRFQTPDRLIFH